MINRRKKKFVDRKVQGRLILGIAIHWLLYFVLILCTIPMWHILTVSGFSEPFPVVLAESWGSMTPVFLFLAAVLPIFIWETVKFSNRFVGPMYRLHKTIRSINAGEPFQPIHFREDDFWHDVADDFNAMMKKLSENEVAAAEEAPEEEELVEV